MVTKLWYKSICNKIRIYNALTYWLQNIIITFRLVDILFFASLVFYNISRRNYTIHSVCVGAIALTYCFVSTFLCCNLVLFIELLCFLCLINMYVL